MTRRMTVSSADVDAARLLLDLNASLGVASDPAITLLAAASEDTDGRIAPDGRPEATRPAFQPPASLEDRLAVLFERHRSGDENAIESLVRLATPVMWGVIRATRADPVTAEDVLQRVWLTFLVESEDIALSSDLLSWLVIRAEREAGRESRRAIHAAPAPTSASDQVEQTLKSTLRGLVAYSPTSAVPA